MKSIFPHSFNWYEAVLALAACLSLFILFMPKEWLSNNLELDPRQYTSALLADDYMGGTSEVSWQDKEQQIWRCVLKPGAMSPACSSTVTVIDETWLGLDLRPFDQMTVLGNYTGKSNYIRVYLRNRDIKYYVSGDESSTKYHAVEIPIANIRDGIPVNLSSFDVADWWISAYNIQPQDSHPEFNEIIYVDFQTGTDVVDGEHVFQITKIIWTGRYISNETLYRSMILGWAILILVLVCTRLAKLKLDLIDNNKSNQELSSINKLLNVQNRQLEELAKIDPLTGVLNRVGIREPLMDSLNNWKKQQTPMSFSLIDIDHFKNINDTLGHDAGDDILKNTAKLISENIRPSDFIARWGGEEFIVVMPNTPINEAKHLMEELRSSLASSNLHPETSVTASFGLAYLKNEDLNILFKEADEALYQAKNEGRNQVCIKQH